jgi:sporulation protein YlmC with PRC-barrel domain
MNISELYGIDIYDDEAKYIGKVNDIILNLETGKIVRLTTEPLRAVSRERAKQVLRERSVLYKNVTSVGDIIIVSKRRGGSAPSEEEIDTGKEMMAKRRSLLGRMR